MHMLVRKHSGNPQGEWQIHLPSQLNPYLDRQSSFLSASRRAWCRSTSLPMLSPPNARAQGPSIFCQAPGDLGCGNPVLGAFGSSTTGHAWSYAVRFIAGSRSGVATRCKSLDLILCRFLRYLSGVDTLHAARDDLRSCRGCMPSALYGDDDQRFCVSTIKQTLARQFLLFF